jgi:hypothetical protein
MRVSDEVGLQPKCWATLFGQPGLAHSLEVPGSAISVQPYRTAMAGSVQLGSMANRRLVAVRALSIWPVSARAGANARQAEAAVLPQGPRGDENVDRHGTPTPIGVQFVDRLHREHHAKRAVIGYDYIDGGVPMLARMATRRQAGYRSLGYEIDYRLMQSDAHCPQDHNCSSSSENSPSAAASELSTLRPSFWRSACTSPSESMQADRRARCDLSRSPLRGNC